MKPILVFYANQLYGECASYNDLSRFRGSCSQEIYNGGYLYESTNSINACKWFRIDGTPVLPVDVPKELLTLLLLLS